MKKILRTQNLRNIIEINLTNTLIIIEKISIFALYLRLISRILELEMSENILRDKNVQRL